MEKTVKDICIYSTQSTIYKYTNIHANYVCILALVYCKSIAYSSILHGLKMGSKPVAISVRTHQNITGTLSGSSGGWWRKIYFKQIFCHPLCLSEIQTFILTICFLLLKRATCFSCSNCFLVPFTESLAVASLQIGKLPCCVHEPLSVTVHDKLCSCWKCLLVLQRICCIILDPFYVWVTYNLTILGKLSSVGIVLRFFPVNIPDGRDVVVVWNECSAYQ